MPTVKDFLSSDSSVRKDLDADVIEWLMAGDPAIRWQVMRDILAWPECEYEHERQRVPCEGWGKQLLALRDETGTWADGIYSPKWTSTTYTLLTLRAMGLPQQTHEGVLGARLIMEALLGPLNDSKFTERLQRVDLCVNGMMLSLLSYFRVCDKRVERIVEHIIEEQMEDGGWNCARRRHGAVHSSLHTTLNVLDGLGDYLEFSGKNADDQVRDAMRRAEEFMLQHRLFLSDKTGAVIREEFTRFSFPPRWHYDVLRGLDYFRWQQTERDNRLLDAITLLEETRAKDGRWKLRNRHPGKEFFQLEKVGQPSQWNTLRALRILKWWRNED